MRSRALIVAVLLLASVSRMSAQFVWSGLGNTASGVTDLNNWVGLQVPTTTADISFGSSALTTVNFPMGANVGNIMFNTVEGTGRPDYTFDSQNSSQLIINGAISLSISGNA